MPLTPQQLAKIRQKELDTPDALKRNPLSNYREGYFHVTLNTRGEAPVLGYIVGSSDAPDDSPDAPRSLLTDLGERVEKVWKDVPSFYPEVEIDAFQAMPEHVHGLLHLKPTNRKHLGQIVRGFMIGCTHAYWDTLGIAWGDAEQQKSGIPHDQAASRSSRQQVFTDRDHTRSFRGPALLVHGYNDVEAVNDEEVEIKRQYIRNNPRKHLIQRDHPDVFRIHRNMKSANWTPERIMTGLCADRFIAADRSKQEEAWRQLTIKGVRNNRGKVSATLHFHDQHPAIDLVGNMDLLKRPLFPLICHRADAHLFEQQKEAVLKVAREQGGVIVTACVSPKERDIVKQLLQELLPVIEVMDNGFADRYKPTGKAFYAVAEARRLEVSPWEYEYRRRELQPVKDARGNPVLDVSGKPEMEEVPDITREMCMVMNELVRTIAKKDDDWWKGQ